MYPNAQTHLGVASGLPGAVDYPWGVETTPAKEVTDAQVDEHYARQRAMIERAAELSRDILKLQAEVQVFLDGIVENGWVDFARLPPFPMRGTNAHIRSVDLAPALAVAQAFVSLAESLVPGPAVYDANQQTVVPGPNITAKKALHAIAKAK